MDDLAMEEDAMITDDEMMAETNIDSQEGEDVLPEETSNMISLSVEDLPSLQDLQIGDELVLTISDISEDGTYQLSAVEGSETLQELPVEGGPQDMIAGAL